jgi:preprotein translocase subunit SecA
MAERWATLRRRFFGLGGKSGEELIAAIRAVQQATRLGPVDLTKQDDPMAARLGVFAAASKHMLGLDPFDTQLRAALAMTDGLAVEMQTGEGKTLAVAAAAAALALAGRHVHVATVNRYLAERDFAKFAPALTSLGLRVGLIVDGQMPDEKRRAYAANVVYGTGYEFGFDYLREQLRLLRARSPRLGARYQKGFEADPNATQAQRALDCAIVDELDSVLLDEACVPLILSEQLPVSNDGPPVFAAAREVALSLRADEHVRFDPLRRTITLTPLGVETVDRALPASLRSELRRPWRTYVEHALSAEHLFRRDVDYIVADRRIWLVDAATGRIFHDRTWSDGLHQAVEFKENVPFSPPVTGTARITRQRFFGLYRSMVGTSGTLAEGTAELKQTYRLTIEVVEPRLPSRRAEWPTAFFADHAARLRAVVGEVASQVHRGRPVLVGCRTIETSVSVAAALSAAGITHCVLNGRQTRDEAEIVAEAGRAAKVTVATNLAGRGTDIPLEGQATQAGGLHVIGVERHDSPRIDRQLLGRAGRQGDPGSGRFFVSAQDALLRAFPTTAEHMAEECRSNRPNARLLHAEIARCQAALEAQARFRRNETAAIDDRLDDLLALLAKSE